MRLAPDVTKLLEETAATLTGVARRVFMARAVRDLFGGSIHRAVRALTWDDRTLRKGLHDLRTGIECCDGRTGAGRPRVEARLPTLRQDLRDLLDSQSQIDPQFASQRLYTRLKLFRWWHWYKAGHRDRAWLRHKMKRLRGEVRRALQDGTVCGNALTEGTCAEILTVEAALWTFVEVAGVEPTNNFAEQQVRHAVLWRKASFGCDSARGSRFVERILTVVMSLRSQGRSILDFLVQALQAARQRASPPSLIPQFPALQAATP
jgi:transposase